MAVASSCDRHARISPYTAFQNMKPPNQLPIPGTDDLYDLFPILYDLALVAGWDPHSLHVTG